jgi:integrase
MPKSTAHVGTNVGTKSPKVRRRSAGEGTVYPFRGAHRGALTWTEPDGTQHKRTVTGRTSAEARDKLDTLRRDLQLGNLAPAGPTQTVGDYLAGWIERHRARVRPSTWLTAESYVRVYLIPALGRRPLARLTATEVETALAAFVKDGRPVRAGDTRRRSPVSPVTARHVRAILRRALSDAHRAGLVLRNVAADAAPPYVEHRPITYLTARDLGRLLDATAEDELGPLYALAGTTGLRRGELLGLTWADVTDGRLSVRRSMGRIAGNGWGLGEVKSARSRRTIPLPLRARQALETVRTRQRFARSAAGEAWQDRAGLVFTDAVGRPMLPETISHRFRRDCARAGVPRIRFHDLRHSAATTLLAAGVPLAVISEWLGHSGIAITASAYAAVVPELLTDAADAMDRALGAGQ